MEQLYEYMSQWYSDGRSEHPVCQGRRAFVEQFISRLEFADLFGGYALSEDVFEEEYLGVWGHRVCQRFRRIMRYRGADFLLNPTPPKLRLKVTSTH